MPATMSLIRRLSSRAKKSTGQQLRKLSSFSARHQQSSSTESIPEADECCCALPENLLFRIVDLCLQDAPVDVCRWRAVSRSFRDHIDRELFGALTELDAKKADLDALLEEDGCWQRASGAAVALRVSSPKVEIVVSCSWTSKDVTAVCGAMNVFRHAVQKVTVDAPIAELIVVSLSMIDLNRWYAFQCFMKAVNDHEMHLARGQVGSNAANASEYWPAVSQLVIRATEKDTTHLARILDYGVRSQFVINRRVLQELRVVLTDVASSNQGLQKNLYHFRCWAGSAGFDDRFSQQYGVVAIQ
uniref:F-box domain-containing protein n=1 Tax=Steinernema glaseri TaxID=37863 RepID=A0A1I8A3F4_9BILA